MEKLKKEIVFMQQVIKTQIIKKIARVEILKNYWNKLLGQLQTQATHNKDLKGKELLSKIFHIPKETRDHVLFSYIERCQQLHNIAFEQWRLRYPSPFVRREDAIELCRFMIKLYLDTTMVY